MRYLCGLSLQYHIHFYILNVSEWSFTISDYIPFRIWLYGFLMWSDILERNPLSWWGTLRVHWGKVIYIFLYFHYLLPCPLQRALVIMPWLKELPPLQPGKSKNLEKVSVSTIFLFLTGLVILLIYQSWRVLVSAHIFKGQFLWVSPLTNLSLNILHWCQRFPW